MPWVSYLLLSLPVIPDLELDLEPAREFASDLNPNPAARLSANVLESLGRGGRPNSLVAAVEIGLVVAFVLGISISRSRYDAGSRSRSRSKNRECTDVMARRREVVELTRL
jgi:hypothetical protein